MKLHEIKQYKTDLDAEAAWKLIEKHCKDALKDLDTPIVRGMKAFPSGCGKIDGSAGERKSANTTNYYTTILDHVLGPDFPRRSKSIICANWENRRTAEGYGDVHAIFPYDGVKIGVCPEDDMWHTIIEFGPGQRKQIYKLNDEFRFQQLPEDSFAGIVKGLEKLVDYFHSRNNQHSWYGFKPGQVEEQLTKAYKAPFKATTTKNSAVYNDGKWHEVWIGGPCIAINMQLYKKMMKNPPDERFNRNSRLNFE